MASEVMIYFHKFTGSQNAFAEHSTEAERVKGFPESRLAGRPSDISLETTPKVRVL